MAGPKQPLTEDEQRIVARIHEARATVRAPESLKARIEAQRPSRTTRARRRFTYGTSLAGAVAAVAVALALILPNGTPGGPTVSEAAALALRGADSPAPGPDSKSPNAKLHRDVEDVYFPNWDAQFHWRAIGQRSDSLGGREAVTVYYTWAGKQVAYTILAAPPLGTPAGQTTMLSGTLYRTLMVNGRLAVTWRRKGHTCVLSATSGSVSASLLRELAAWQVPDRAHS
jgi:hypothetical protein